MQFKAKAAGLAAGVAALTASLIGGALPAQAYDPDPTVSSYSRDTDTCPCSGGTLGDPFDGTYFEYDAGGTARKLELYSGDWFVGKVEFHPYQQKLWVYDTKNDGDTFYVHVAVDNHDGHGLTGWGQYKAPGTSAVMDYETFTLRNVSEGASIRIRVFDDEHHTDLIATAYGTA
ncbi:hypothetical protein H9Y04_09395 [Streptomyces sp. TRM66268-LWL]|uniref:Secreted protein n=1 Tax=Streptomyces polyasparticus TaxID=2767826 RepID=A0ABR7SBD6_9ACTN|nr:hypothetical protein [Streptomyces polyasparticus]MBC9712786.1 hypothetical protein [Streptomyces polyasparticus]